MASLPTVGGNNGTWGTVLNDYLSVEHNADGTHSIDAADVTYTPADNTKWNSSADPGNTNSGLDQLATRVKTIESAVSSPPTQIDPTSISGCILWLDADQVSGSDGDLIATWTDLSTSGNNATQSTESSRPMLRTYAANGRKCLMFDGIGDHLTLGTEINPGNDHSLIMVSGLIRGYGGYGCLFKYRQQAVYSQLNGSSFCGFYRGGDITVGPVTAKPMVWGTLATDNTDYDIFVGTARKKGTTTSAYDSSPSTSRVGWDGAGSQVHQGPIYEIIVYDNKISEANFVALINWLEYKWGIT